MKALVLLLLLAPATAFAQAPEEPIGGGKFNVEDPDSPGRPSDYRSPQAWAMEFRFGPYRPDVDSDPALKGATPYGEFFGDGSSLLFSFELDYQLWHRFGSLAIGGSLGYFRDPRAAVFVFKRRLHTITLFVMLVSGFEWPTGNEKPLAEHLRVS